MDYSPRYGHFRALLRQIREEAGMNQMSLAAKLGKPQTFISKSELGERRLDYLETADFCEACGVSITQFAERLEAVEPRQAQLKRVKRKSPRQMDGKGLVTQRKKA